MTAISRRHAVLVAQGFHSADWNCLLARAQMDRPHSQTYIAEVHAELLESTDAGYAPIGT